jgi:hypothetical protein
MPETKLGGGRHVENGRFAAGPNYASATLAFTWACHGWKLNRHVDLTAYEVSRHCMGLARTGSSPPARLLEQR